MIGLRVYRLARDLGISSDAILRIAHRLSLGDRLNQLSILSDDQCDLIKEAITHRPPDDPGEPTGIHNKLPPRGPSPQTGRAKSEP